MRPIPQHIREYISAAPVCRIGTVRDDGEPHVIPVCPVFDGDATVHVDLAIGSVSERALEAEPRVLVLIDEYYDDWTRLRKVLLRCTAERVEGSEQEAAWASIRTKFPQYVTVEWEPRATMALRVYGWLAEGFERAR